MLKGLTETCSCNQRVSFVSPLGDLRSTESVPNLTGTSQFSIYVWKPPALTLSILTSVCWPLPWLNCMTLVSLPRTFLSFQSVGGITEFLLNVKTNIFSWFFVPLGSQAVFANENVVYCVYEHKGTTAGAKTLVLACTMQLKKDGHPMPSEAPWCYMSELCCLLNTMALSWATVQWESCADFGTFKALAYHV